MKFSLFVKAVSLFVVMIMLIMGMSLIGSVVDERVRYREQAASGIRQSLAGPQSIAAPMMTRACVETVETVTETPKGKVTEKIEQARTLKSLPQSVKWTIASKIEPRYRGLYKVNSYRLDASAEVAWTSLAELATPSVNAPVLAIRCDEPKLVFPVNDPRGIRSIKLDWRDAPLTAQSLSSNEAFATGFEAMPPVKEQNFADAQRLRMSMELVGVEALSFVPLGNENLVEMTSDWPHPSFAGAFLPNERSVTEKGFQAKWNVSSLATNARASALRGDTLCDQPTSVSSEPRYAGYASAATAAVAHAAANAPKGCLQSFGVGFIDPVNPSTLADRATKYAFLFIALTFVGIVMLEVMRDVQVHPIQYLLIGAALAVFFLLLLSLSEHIHFALAYTIAAAACIALIGVYAKSVFGGKSRAIATMAGLGVLYLVLYVVLQSEQHALLAGSLLIFAALAGVMLLTRGVNWSAFGAKVAASSKRDSSASNASAIDRKAEAV
jgi:inner membrane protein